MTTGYAVEHITPKFKVRECKETSPAEMREKVMQLELKDIGPIKHHFAGGVYAKEMRLQKGHIAITHSHNYDHMSVLVSGRVMVNCDGAYTEYAAPQVIEIKKDIEHGIAALEDTVWLCIHRIPDGLEDMNNIDEFLIKE